MKKLILILASLLLVGCVSKATINYPEQIKEEVLDGFDNHKIVIYDSCEYIQVDIYNSISVTHKGNCKFCLKRGYSTKNSVMKDERGSKIE